MRHGGARAQNEGRAVRDLPGRRAVPRGRPGHGDAARAARPRGRLPRRRRPAAARCTPTPATSARRCRWCATTSRSSRRTTSIVAPSGSCVGSVRHQHAMVAAQGRRRRRWPSGRTRRRAHLRAVRAARRRAGRRRTSARTSRTGSPTTRPATRCGCCGSTTSRCGCCARCAASTWSSCPTPTSAAASAARSRSRTPTPRPRCSPTRCATCSAPVPRRVTAGDSSCLMHIGGGLSRLRTGTRTAAPRRDPGVDRGRSPARWTAR